MQTQSKQVKLLRKLQHMQEPHPREVAEALRSTNNSNGYTPDWGGAECDRPHMACMRCSQNDCCNVIYNAIAAL